MERNQLQVFFTWRTAILRSDLSPTVRHILLTLSCYMNESSQSAFPAIKRIASETGLSKQCVIKNIKKAEDSGWLFIERRLRNNGSCTSNLYHPQIPVGGKRGLPGGVNEDYQGGVNEDYPLNSNSFNSNSFNKEKIYKKEKPLPEDSEETPPDEDQNPSRKINIKKADRIIAHLNSVAGTNFRPVKPNREHIIARLNDGYSYSDCIKAIDNKSKDQWVIDHPGFMNPITVFRPKHFESCLNYAPPKPKQIVGGKRLKMERGSNGIVCWNMDGKEYNIDDTDTHPEDMKAWYRKEYPNEYKG